MMTEAGDNPATGHVAPTAATGTRGRARMPLWRRVAMALVRVVVPVVVVWLVWGELTRIDWPQVRAEMGEANFLLLLAAALVVAANVAAMGLYDAVSFPRTPELGFVRRWGIGSLCFAWSNFLTIGPIGGPALRFLVYGRRGLSPGQVARGLGAQYMGFGGGLIGWLVASALPLYGWAGLAMRAGIALGLAVTLAMLFKMGAIAALRWRARTLHKEVSESLEQIRRVRAWALGVVGFLDWGCSMAAFAMVAWAAGMVLDAGQAARTFLGGHVVGMVSMMPGGLGSADATWLYGLTEAGHEADVAAAGIVLFRAVFYLLPWVVAAIVTLTVAGPRFEDSAAWRARVLALVVVVYAAIMVAAQALPSGHAWPMVNPVPPTIAMTQASHVIGLLAAVGAACLAPGLAARSGQAWRVTLWCAALGLGAHALKADDAQEVLVSALVVVLAFAARRDFQMDSQWRAPWWTAGAIVAACTVWYWLIGVQAFPRRVLDAGDLLVFGSAEGAGRFVRGGVLLALLSAGVLVTQACRVGARGRSG